MALFTANIRVQVGLAVDDIHAIQEKAKLHRLVMQVSLSLVIVYYYSWFWVTDWQLLQMNTGLVDKYTRKRQSMVGTEGVLQFQAATGAACIYIRHWWILRI